LLKGEKMFITLLIATFIISFAVTTIVVLIFARPLNQILDRIISDQISRTWSKYLKFAMYVIGISSGVRIWDLEKYITKPQYQGSEIIQLTTERWVLEIYRTIIGTLQGIAWMLLVFFIFALVAYVIVRISEMRNKAKNA
jgi:hypothetical protein